MVLSIATVVGTVAALVLAFVLPAERNRATWVQAVLAGVLVVITALYTWMTERIADDTLNAARASERSAEEARRSADAALAQQRESAAMTAASLEAAAATREAADAAKSSVDEARLARLNDALPVLNLSVTPGVIDESRLRGTFTVHLRNVGVGPAIFVKHRWRASKYLGDDGRWQTDETGKPIVQAWIVNPLPPLSALGPGDTIDMVFDAPFPRDRGPYHDRPVDQDPNTWRGWSILGVLRVEYRDIHDRSGMIQRGVVLRTGDGPATPQLDFGEDTQIQVPGQEHWHID
ncbi:MAG: hypothetical protein QOF33_2103 [Thermomicrobiales bacterium]|jgi:hypothetical protein|nr:hypothetical protein [Thermomicrobiales bacterium]